MLRYFFILTTLSLVLLSDTGESLSIDAEIAKIKTAQPSERVRLMNRFKLRVSQMNAQERLHAIGSMRKSMHREEHRVKDHSLEIQTQHSSDMQHYQNMNQRQAGEKLSHENSQGRAQRGEHFLNQPHKKR